MSINMKLTPTPASADEKRHTPHLERRQMPASEHTPIVIRLAIRANHRINIGKDCRITGKTLHILGLGTALFR